MSSQSSRADYWLIYDTVDALSQPLEVATTSCHTPKRRKVSPSRHTRLTLLITDSNSSIFSTLLFNSPLVDSRYRYLPSVFSWKSCKHCVNDLAKDHPNVTSLDLCIDGVPSSVNYKLMRLLRQWKKLTSLRLFACYSNNDLGFTQELPMPPAPTGHIYELLACVSALPTLKRLFVDIRHYLFFQTMDSVCPFPISSSSIEELYIYNLEMDLKRRRQFVSSLSVYLDENPNLQKLGIETAGIISAEDLRFSKFTSRLVALNLTNYTDMVSKLTCCSFLTNLSLTVQPHTIEKWSKTLGTLEHLHTLWLTVCFIASTPVDSAVISRLETVKVLKIDWFPSADSKNDLAELSLSETFPSIELIRLYYNGSISLGKVDLDTWYQLTGQFLQPVKACSKLSRVIYTDFSNYIRDEAFLDFKAANHQTVSPSAEEMPTPDN